MGTFDFQSNKNQWNHIASRVIFGGGLQYEVYGMHLIWHLFLFIIHVISHSCYCIYVHI